MAACRARLPAGSVNRSPACQANSSSPPSRVEPWPRITKNSWLVALASVKWQSPGRTCTKLAHSPGAVAGPAHSSRALASSGVVRVGPPSWSAAGNRAPGIGGSVPLASGLEAER